ncbi:MAG: phage protein NinX family protein [Aeromonadaceae bacterium]
MNYEEMSDHEINQAVTCEVFGCHDWGVNKDGSFYHCGILGDAYIHQKVVDYCNNPSDAWPIMVANGIATVAENGILVGATNNSQEFYEPYGSVVHSYTHANPIRAAMIVFLIMQEAKRG